MLIWIVVIGFFLGIMYGSAFRVDRDYLPLFALSGAVVGVVIYLAIHFMLRLMNA
jgi:hypothetical protein